MDWMNFKQFVPSYRTLHSCISINNALLCDHIFLVLLKLLADTNAIDITKSMHILLDFYALHILYGQNEHWIKIECIRIHISITSFWYSLPYFPHSNNVRTIANQFFQQYVAAILCLDWFVHRLNGSGQSIVHNDSAIPFFWENILKSIFGWNLTPLCVCVSLWVRQ